MCSLLSFHEDEPLLDLEQEAAPGAELLYVRLVDEQMQPLAGLAVELDGAGLKQSALTDDQGELFLDGCPAGTYTLSSRGIKRSVHTLTHEDLARSPTPYLSVLC